MEVCGQVAVVAFLLFVASWIPLRLIIFFPFLDSKKHKVNNNSACRFSGIFRVGLALLYRF